MRKKCHTCLCRTCLNICCDRKACEGKKEHCEKYKGFQQLSIFDCAQKKRYQSAPRQSWEYYGLGDKTYRKRLYKICQSGEYGNIIRSAAYRANKDIAKHIIKSVTQNKSYDKIEFDRELGRICVGKSDFYRYRRLFYSLFDRELRSIGK